MSQLVATQCTRHFGYVNYDTFILLSVAINPFNVFLNFTEGILSSHVYFIVIIV